MKRTIPVIRVTRETLENLMKSRAGLVQQRVWVKDSGNKKGHWRMQWVQPGTGKTDATEGQMDLFGNTEGSAPAKNKEGEFNVARNVRSMSDEAIASEKEKLLPQWQKVQKLLADKKSYTDGTRRYQETHEKEMPHKDYKRFNDLMDEQRRRLENPSKPLGETGKKPEPDKPQSQAMRDIDDRKKRIDEIKKEYAGKELPNHAQIELRMHQSALSDLYKEAGIKPDSETENSEISRMLNESSRGKEHYDDDTAGFNGQYFDPDDAGNKAPKKNTDEMNDAETEDDGKGLMRKRREELVRKMSVTKEKLKTLDKTGEEAKKEKDKLKFMKELLKEFDDELSGEENGSTNKQKPEKSEREKNTFDQAKQSLRDMGYISDKGVSGHKMVDLANMLRPHMTSDDVKSFMKEFYDAGIKSIQVFASRNNNKMPGVDRARMNKMIQKRKALDNHEHDMIDFRTALQDAMSPYFGYSHTKVTPWHPEHYQFKDDSNKKQADFIAEIMSRAGMLGGSVKKTGKWTDLNLPNTAPAGQPKTIEHTLARIRDFSSGPLAQYANSTKYGDIDKFRNGAAQWAYENNKIDSPFTIFDEYSRLKGFRKSALDLFREGLAKAFGATRA